MKNMKRQTAVRQSSLYSAPLFIALFSILLPSRLVALDLDPVRVGGYDTSGEARGVAVSGNYDDARIFGGIHFRFDQEAGARQGSGVGSYVWKNHLRPLWKLD